MVSPNSRCIKLDCCGQSCCIQQAGGHVARGLLYSHTHLALLF